MNRTVAACSALALATGLGTVGASGAAGAAPLRSVPEGCSQEEDAARTVTCLLEKGKLSFAVPRFVTSMHVQVRGAAGGSGAQAGGQGGILSADVGVAPGWRLEAVAGEAGVAGGGPTDGGGGAAGDADAGSGGGASAVVISQPGVATKASVVAGGGGGGGSTGRGGSGGGAGTAGRDGGAGTGAAGAGGGRGGTQTKPGVGGTGDYPGHAGAGVQGGAGSGAGPDAGGGGGGGGGWYGGGGGGKGGPSTGGGGGGGSSYAAGKVWGVRFLGAENVGAGSVTITWREPCRESAVVNLGRARVREGDAGERTLRVPFRLSRPLLCTGVDVVARAVPGGTARLRQDYVGPYFRGAVGRNQRVGAIVVRVRGDRAFEADETIKIRLSTVRPRNPELGSVRPGVVTTVLATIVNDDERAPRKKR